MTFGHPTALKPRPPKRPVFLIHCGQCQWLLVTSKDDATSIVCQNPHCPQHATPFTKTLIAVGPIPPPDFL